MDWSGWRNGGAAGLVRQLGLTGTAAREHAGLTGVCGFPEAFGATYSADPMGNPRVRSDVASETKADLGPRTGTGGIGLPMTVKTPTASAPVRAFLRSHSFLCCPHGRWS